jgi:hypothetical protein
LPLSSFNKSRSSIAVAPCAVVAGRMIWSVLELFWGG